MTEEEVVVTPEEVTEEGTEEAGEMAPATEETTPDAE